MLVAYATNRFPDAPSFHKAEDLSIIATPIVLRELASFLIACAETMEREQELTSEWHMHFRDHNATWTEDMADIIVSGKLAE
jgi:hypothetical protein